MIKINLLPRERVRRPAIAPRLLVPLAVVAAVVFVALVALNQERQIYNLNQDIKTEQARIEELKPQVAEVEALQQQITEARKKEQLLRELEALRIPWERVLNELRKIMPADVWLIRIDAKGDGNLTFNGFGMSYEAVARFMVNLDASPVFEGADLTIGQKQSQAGRDVVNFSVTAHLASAQKEVGVR